MRVKVKNLTDPRDLEQIRQLRVSSPRYAELRQRLATIFKDRRCIVIGSAPDLGEVDRHDDDLIVCVNGSSHNAERLGIVLPDVTFFVSYVFTRGNRIARMTCDLLRGRASGACMILSGTMSFDDSVSSLRDLGVSYRSLEDISPHEKAALTGDVCGIELNFGRLEDRVSTGATAAIGALWAGAREVHLAGFSLHGGHSYAGFTSRRYHKGPDATFFALCREKRLPVTSASTELRERFGIPARL